MWPQTQFRGHVIPVIGTVVRLAATIHVVTVLLVFVVGGSMAAAEGVAELDRGAAATGGSYLASNKFGLCTAPEEDKLVAVRHPVRSTREEDGPAAAGGIQHWAVAEDTHGGVLNEDSDDPERAVSEEQPRRAGAAGVAGEVESWPVAPRLDAEGVRHGYVAAAGGAARQPDRRRPISSSNTTSAAAAVTSAIALPSLVLDSSYSVYVS